MTNKKNKTIETRENRNGNKGLTHEINQTEEPKITEKNKVE